MIFGGKVKKRRKYSDVDKFRSTGSMQWDRIEVSGLILVWYSCSVVANNAGKLLLPRFPFPVTVTLIQFILSSSAIPISQFLRGKPVKPLLDLLRVSWRRGVLLGSAGIVSGVSHRVSLMFITVSFAHTVKSLQPFFSAGLSRLLLGQSFSWLTISALAIVVSGVALAAFTEFQFSLVGFMAAETSAMAMSVANVCQKKFLNKDVDAGAAESHGSQRKLDKSEVFFLTNAFSVFFLLPVVLAMDYRRLVTYVYGSEDSPAEAPSDGLRTLVLLALNTGTMTVQHFVSLTVLAMLNPVSHAVMNSCKRVVVILISVACESCCLPSFRCSATLLHSPPSSPAPPHPCWHLVSVLPSKQISATRSPS